MKKSSYNYIVPHLSHYYLFNGLSKKFIILSESTKNSLLTLLDHLDNYVEDLRYAALITKLKEGGFITEDHIDEFAILNQRCQAAIDKKRLSITVFPTYQCNFSCWYCIQHHREEYMSRETIDRLKNFIYRYTADNGIEEIEIAWFGGEPLLCFHSHILGLCRDIKQFADKNKLYYYNTITTNGFYLTQEIARLTRDLNFKVFQISLDGDRERHDKTRYMPDSGQSSFDTILRNIISLIDNHPEAFVCLRFNYDAENMGGYKQMLADINARIPVRYRSKINFHPRKVWQEKNEIAYNEIRNMFIDFENSGYTILEYDMPFDYLVCEAERKHRYVLFFNGYVDKCENIQPDMASHVLSDDGALKKRSDAPFLIQKCAFIVNSQCKKCRYVPICLGPCKVALSCRADNQPFCVLENKQQSIHQRIINYCESITKSRSHESI